MNPKVIFLLIILSSLPALSRNSKTGHDTGWDARLLNTAASVTYLNQFEKEIIFEINKLRSNPPRYASEYIAPLAEHYRKKILYYPGDKPLLTREGVRALHECVRELKKQPPLPLLYPRKGLSRAARDHARDQSKTGATGHRGADGSGFRDRIERHGDWNVRIAENIAYGGTSAQQVVIYLLIDDGVPGRGHRINFLTPEFKTIGVATEDHPGYNVITVMDFAGNFKTASP